MHQKKCHYGHLSQNIFSHSSKSVGNLIEPRREKIENNIGNNIIQL